ncbi:hypothetical protein PVIIG_05266 [Plasmodium vivax India VII]|uniref:VIR protein n=1 Tax=Plasmodium vivax India VII TaxID=1077284 RepID=A0A0J9SK20_PLAVI|nr:hypothetical protein PVIIG_05266 [Plasmodium vivax India VII]
MEVFLEKSKLDSLNTIINYDNFDKYKNNCYNYPNITTLKYLLGGNFWGKNISDELLNALCYVYKRHKDDTLDRNICNYLYYWLGSKVLTNLRHTYFFFDVLKKIYYILSRGERGQVCDPAGYNIYHHNFHKFKLVYDLSEDYETYKSHFSGIMPSCDKDYDEAIQSYKYLYNDLRKKCTIERTNYYEPYCQAFNEYFTEEKNAQISLWKCQLREDKQEVQQLEKEPGEDAATKHIQEELEVVRQQVQEDSYSPARSWINKLLGMNKGTNRNPYANQELMAEFSMPEDFYSERNRYNIMYNPE